METGPSGFKAGVGLGHGSVWTGEGWQAVTDVSDDTIGVPLLV